MNIQNIKTRLKHFVAVNFAIVTFALVGVVGIAPVASAELTSGDGCQEGNVTLEGGTQCAQPTGVAENLTGQGGIFATVANILLFLVGAVAVIMLIIGGIRYTLSGGDSGAVTSAKNTILYAIIGLIVAFQ